MILLHLRETINKQMKNIVICLDGTGNEFGLNNSNVVKLYQTLKSDSAQLAYYHPGLGTMGSPGAWSKLAAWWTKVLGQAIGFGLAETIGDAYQFLMNNFEEDDRVYIFGFSRGAYMARALASLLYMFGLASRGNDAVVRYVVRMLSQKDRSKFAIAPQFRDTFSRNCVPHFIGVWDTVSSVGLLYNPIKIPYTANNPAIQIGRHAISIDERRVFFRQNLWHENPGQGIRQVWFAGVHSDIGGGYAEPESGLAKITLEWMLREAEIEGLQVDSAKREQVLGKNKTSTSYASPDPCAQMHQSLKTFWYLAALVPRLVTFQKQVPNGKHEYKQRLVMGAGRARSIADGANVHASVIARTKCQNLKYHPPNLPNKITIVD
jgi:uncharacterized protein (DUF2235 family)